MSSDAWDVINPKGANRIVVTKALPGRRWRHILVEADCRIEVGTADRALTAEEIAAAIGERCDGAIGQITERWGGTLFAALRKAGGRAYSNYAVGFDNVDLAAATANGIPVGNTPGVLTETTAEMAVALAFAAARRCGESERFLRAGKFESWLPKLFLGELLWRKTVGVIGAGRIGSAFARMMVEGHKMNLLYYSRHRNEHLENFCRAYDRFLEARGESPVTCRRVKRLETLLAEADCVSLHTTLNASTHHLINSERLALMKPNAVLVNTSRGPVIDEAALVAHCRSNPQFRAGLDVFEHEPRLTPGLAELENVVIVPHTGSATRFAREGMATLAAANVAALLQGYPAWNRPDVTPFLSEQPPKAAPSIVNADDLGIARYAMPEKQAS
jgi:hydroxypyruvate reductase 1